MSFGVYSIIFCIMKMGVNSTNSTFRVTMDWWS